jgi:hypothetical protein
MIATLKRFPVISALAAVAVVLLAIVLLEIASGSVAQRQLANVPVQRTAVVEAKLLPAITPVSAEDAYPESGARPLFTPTRRPAPPGTVATTSAIPKGQFVLTGVTIAGPLRIALLREKSTGRVVRIEKGKEVSGVAGMTVAQIEPDSVTLAMSGDQEVLPLRVQKGPGAPAAAATGPFAGPAAPAATPAPAPAPAPSIEAPIAAGQNPAARPPSPPSAFGPATAMPPAPPAAAPGSPNANQSTPMTPEELLARRRARRTQQTQ